MQIGKQHISELEDIYDSVGENEEVEVEESGDDQNPDIEEQAITNFPEKGELPDIGMELNLFRYSVSVATDGERLKVSIDTPIYRSEVSQNLLYKKPSHGGYFESYQAIGVKVQGNTSYLLKNKTVKNAAGKAGKVLGGVGFSNSTFEGNYIIRDYNNKIIDRGTIYIRDKGGSIGNFGRSEGVVVRKSSATGLAVKSKSVKYSFSFASISVSP